jgi:omega-amidase
MTFLVPENSSPLLFACPQVHLFDIDIPGGVTFKESDTLTAGEAITVVDTEAGRLGIAICYDIRFPELAQIYAQRGAQLIVYPGRIQNMLLNVFRDLCVAKSRCYCRQRL